MCSEGNKMKSVAALLPDFVQHLDKELKRENLSPRFGLAGFSGKAPVHRLGHAHTLQGKLLSEAKDFTARAIRNMEFAVR